MRPVLIIGIAVVLAGCTAATQPAPVVSWSYGTGNGDGVAYPGGAPTYARAYGLGNGDGVKSTDTVSPQYAYGAENQSGSMVQMVPTPKTVVAAPASAAPGTHL